PAAAATGAEVMLLRRCQPWTPRASHPSGGGLDALGGRDTGRGLLGGGCPHEAEAQEEAASADAGEDADQRHAHGQRLCGDGADTELTDQTVRGAAPGHLANLALERVLAVEVGPVLAVDVDLVGAGLEGLTVVLD